MSSADPFAPFARKMADAGQASLVTETFRRAYDRLRGGERGTVSSAEIDVLDDVTDIATLGRYRDAGIAALRQRRGDEAERRPRHDHGPDPGQVAAAGEGRPHLPRHHRAPGPAPASRVRDAPAARADEQLPDARGFGAHPRALSRAGGRRARRFPAAQGAAHPGVRPVAGVVAARSGARVVPAGARRHLRGAPDLGRAARAARRRHPVRLRLQRGQPGRRARSGDPRLDRHRAGAVRHGGLRSLRGGQEGRPRGAPKRRPPHAARVQPVPARGAGELPGHRSLALLQHQHALARHRGAGRHARGERRHRRAAADRQPEAGRSRRPVVAPGDPARDRHGRGHRAVRRRARAARHACALRAGQVDERSAGAVVGRLRARRTTTAW